MSLHLRLHAFTGVAELKLEIAPLPPLGELRLHAFTGVAELKQGVAAAAGDRHQHGLHAFTGVAELKPESAEAEGREAGGVSTPSPAWPN